MKHRILYKNISLRTYHAFGDNIPNNAISSNCFKRQSYYAFTALNCLQKHNLLSVDLNLPQNNTREQIG